MQEITEQNLPISLEEIIGEILERYTFTVFHSYADASQAISEDDQVVAVVMKKEYETSTEREDVQNNFGVTTHNYSFTIVINESSANFLKNMSHFFKNTLAGDLADVTTRDVRLIASRTFGSTARFDGLETVTINTTIVETP